MPSSEKEHQETIFIENDSRYESLNDEKLRLEQKLSDDSNYFVTLFGLEAIEQYKQESNKCDLDIKRNEQILSLRLNEKERLDKEIQDIKNKLYELAIEKYDIQKSKGKYTLAMASKLIANKDKEMESLEKKLGERNEASSLIDDSLTTCKSIIRHYKSKKASYDNMIKKLEKDISKQKNGIDEEKKAKDKKRLEKIEKEILYLNNNCKAINYDYKGELEKALNDFSKGKEVQISEPVISP